MTTLFINCSKDTNGTTASLAKQITDNYQTLNLVEYLVYPLGQENQKDDQFKVICDQVAKFDTLIIGTPVYWSSMSAYMKILIDRMTGVLHNNNPFDGKDLYLIIDGFMLADAIPHIKHVWEHVAKKFGMNLEKTITN